MQQHSDDLADLDHDDDPYDDRDAEEPDDELEPAWPTRVARPAATALTVNRPDLAAMAARRIPYAYTGLTAATGLTALGLTEAAAAAGQPALAGTIAVGTWIATGAGLPVLRLRLRDRTVRGRTVERIPRAHRRRWWTAGGVGALWIDAMATGAVDVIGPWGMGAILLGGAAALSARWMREHPVELPSDTPPPLPVAPDPPAIAPPPPRFPAPPPPDEGDLIRELWETRVAGGPNPLVPGSTLGDDRVDLPYGYQWVVQLDPLGNITAARLRALAEDIALKLERDTNHVDIDRLQDGNARQDRALLTVITRDALAGGVEYLGPDYRDGLIRLGKYADGSGSPDWVARDNTGSQHGMVTGGTGSGKSELLTRLGMAYRYSGEWTVVFTDGHEQGRSAPLLNKLAYDFGKGAADALEQLEAIEAWRHATGEIMGAYTEDEHGNPAPLTDPIHQEVAKKLMPSRGLNGLVWIIDEFHRLVKALGRNFVDRVEALARDIRKLGGAIIIGTQSATLVDWGDNEILRGLMAQGNCVIMRTKNSTEQLVVADFGCDPTTLPKGGGYLFVDDPDGRKVMARGEYSRHMHRWLAGLPEYRPAEIPALVYASKRPPKAADPRVDWDETQRRIAQIREGLATGGRMPWEPQTATDGEQQPVSAVGGDGVAAPGQAEPDWSQYTAGGVGIAPPALGPMFAAGQAAMASPPATLGDTQMVTALRFLAANTSAYAGEGARLVAAYQAGELDDVTRHFAEDVAQRLAGTNPNSAPVPVPALTAKAEQVRTWLWANPGPHATGYIAEQTGMPLPTASKALGVLYARGEATRPNGVTGTYAGVQPARTSTAT